MTTISLQQVFEDTETARMGEAFRIAWAYIEECGGLLASADQREHTRERLASIIISLVRQTEPSAESLRDAALQQLGFVAVDVVCATRQSLN